tara:strand:+ start:3180 stop:3503 length:324 start_codon:yes stop_codon:yes gene_type:complete
MIKIDPKNHYAHLDEQHIHELLGMIPFYVADRDIGETVKETLTRNYGFGELIEMDGEITDSVYQSPSDPDLFPLAEMMSEDSTVLQYPYGIISIVDADGSTFITRMD